MEKKADKPNVRLGIFEGRYSYSEIKVGSKTGETLMAFDEETLEFVVIKRPSPTQPNPDARKASIADLEREEKVLRTKDIGDHPAVCRLLSAGNARGKGNTYRYLVLARARGTPVSALIQHYHDQGHPFPEAIYLNIMRQLLDLLAVAHRVGIVYNDVKVDHLFWDENAEQLKVIDWGNAQFVGAANAASPAADVFQCGELLYEFISGDKYVPLSLRDWEASGRPQWEIEFYQSVPDDLKQWVSKSLHPDPKQRYGDARQMAEALEAYPVKKDGTAPVLLKEEHLDVKQPAKPVSVLDESERDASPSLASPSLEEAAMPNTPPLPPEMKRRIRQKVRFSRTVQSAYPRWVAAGVVIVTIAAGLVIAGFFTEFGRGTSRGSPVAVITMTETFAPVFTPSQPLSPTPVDATQQACGKILEAERAGLWESVIQQVGVIMVQLKPPPTACGNRELTQIVANARLQLQCVQARTTKDPVLVQQMAREFGASEVQAKCGINPVDFVATVVPPTADIDLLASLAAKRQSFLVCLQSPCTGGLYQDESQRWRWRTLFVSQGVYLALDEQFQTKAIDRNWGDKIRGFDIELSMASNNPSSFAYGSEAGLEIRSVRGKVMRLSLTSQPVFSAAVNLVDLDSNKTVCEVAVKSFVVADGNGDLKRHKFSFKWKPEGSLQLFVDDQPLCKDSIPFPDVPRAALYLNGRGIDFFVSRLAVTLASP
ncbi:MAG: hypothetical protein HZC38_16545 [Chloroflexi bacterium]|nr:hypothetical protein [Chloroflexota bacterium]